MTDEDDIVWRDLPCELDSKDLERLADEQSANSLEADELKDRASVLSTKRTGLVKDNLRLARVVKAREETRQVKCKWIESIAENVTRLIRQDTGDEVDSRALTQDDLQRGLGFGDDPDNRQDGGDVEGVLGETDTPTTESQDVDGSDGEDDDPTDAPSDETTEAGAVH